MKIGCHAVLFKDAIKNDTDKIIKMLASTGFSGSEIGSRFFGTEDKQALLSVLDKNNYQMSAMHVGVVLNDWDNNGEEMEKNILSVADFVSDMENKNIMMSTVRYEGNDKVAIIKGAKGIEKIAKKCLRKGVTLNFHNHSWEFKNGALIFNALVEHAPSLKFGFDLGWLYVSGYDPIEMLKKYKDRINYVHLRDYDKEKNFVDLGEGIVDYLELRMVLEDVLGGNGWAVVEYETGDEDINRYVKAYKYLKESGY